MSVACPYVKLCGFPQLARPSQKEDDQYHNKVKLDKYTKQKNSGGGVILKRKDIVPTLTERFMREDDFIVSKTDTKGLITYGNPIFIEFSGYTEAELLGSQHNIVRHPDMPRSAFKLAWDTIQGGKEFFATSKTWHWMAVSTGYSRTFPRTLINQVRLSVTPPSAASLNGVASTPSSRYTS
jgi:hypothetical protein